MKQEGEAKALKLNCFPSEPNHSLAPSCRQSLGLLWGGGLSSPLVAPLSFAGEEIRIRLELLNADCCVVLVEIQSCPPKLPVGRPIGPLVGASPLDLRAALVAAPSRLLSPLVWAPLAIQIRPNWGPLSLDTFHQQTVVCVCGLVHSSAPAGRIKQSGRRAPMEEFNF